MKTETFTGSTRQEAEEKVKKWRAAHPGIDEKNYVLSEDGTPAGRFTRKANRTNTSVSISISYEDRTEQMVK